VTAGSGARYELRVAGPAARQLDRLDERVAAAIVEFMLGSLLENPQRVGRQLRRELAGLYSARRGAYRIVYEIDDEHTTVNVLRIDHRSTVYRTR
jgi:mRNA interferase RelE/StbE